MFFVLLCETFTFISFCCLATSSRPQWSDVFCFFFYENIQSHWKTKTKINEKSFSLKSNIILNRIYTHVYYILVLSLLRVVILSVTVSNHSQNIYTRLLKKVFYFKVALDFRIDYILFDHIWLTIWVFFFFFVCLVRMWMWTVTTLF